MYELASYQSAANGCENMWGPLTKGTTKFYASLELSKAVVKGIID